MVSRKLKLLNLVKYQALAQVANYNDSDKKKLSHGIEDILLTCKFNYASCDAIDFSWTWDDYHGNCYMFNSNTSSIKTSTQSGPFFGLQLELFAGFDGNIHFLNILD